LEREDRGVGQERKRTGFEAAGFDLIEFVRKYSLSAIILTGTFFLGRMVEISFNTQELRDLKIENKELKKSISTLADSLNAQRDQKTQEQPADKSKRDGIKK
jgi:hypothetical protein